MSAQPARPEWIDEVVREWCGCNSVMREQLADSLWRRALEEGRMTQVMGPYGAPNRWEYLLPMGTVEVWSRRAEPDPHKDTT